MGQSTISWLNMLPEPARSRAIENTSEKALQYVHHTGIDEAIQGAFQWSKSPEGYQYWKHIYDGYKTPVPYKSNILTVN